ncbi:MAG: hypothetical protein U5L11_08290 [Arhodomonas sp.]|nr:hypothetical protein [Arhodomonas sp.]
MLLDHSAQALLPLTVAGRGRHLRRLRLLRRGRRVLPGRGARIRPRCRFSARGDLSMREERRPGARRWSGRLLAVRRSSTSTRAPSAIQAAQNVTRGYRSGVIQLDLLDHGSKRRPAAEIHGARCAEPPPSCPASRVEVREAEAVPCARASRSRSSRPRPKRPACARWTRSAGCHGTDSAVLR